MHLLCYMNERNYTSLSIANIEKVNNDLMREISLSAIGIYIPEQLKDDIIFSHKSIINKSKEQITIHLLSFAYTWNSYSLGIIYLFILSYLDSKIYPHRFTQGFSQILLEQTFIGRESNENTINKLEKFICSITEKEWNSIFSQI